MKCKISPEKIIDLHDELRNELIRRISGAGDYSRPATEDFCVAGVFTEKPDFDVLQKLCEHVVAEGDTEYDGQWSEAYLYTFLKEKIGTRAVGSGYYICLGFGGLSPALAVLPFLAAYSDIKTLHVTFTRDKWEARGDVVSQNRVGIKVRKGKFVVGKFRDDDDDGEDETRKSPSIIGLGINDIQIGDICSFGTYTQDSDDLDIKEAIEWIVLDKKKTSVLLISRQALDCQPFNTSGGDVTWETCFLREWLNGTFFDDAFSGEEQALIQSTTVKAHKNPKWKTEAGNPTEDKVFLLSITEAKKYFSSKEARACVPTDYAIAQVTNMTGRHLNSGEYTCPWWLRTPGINLRDAAHIGYDGHIFESGPTAIKPLDCVRPALWVKLKA